MIPAPATQPVVPAPGTQPPHRPRRPPARPRPRRRHRPSPPSHPSRRHRSRPPSSPRRPSRPPRPRRPSTRSREPPDAWIRDPPRGVGPAALRGPPRVHSTAQFAKESDGRFQIEDSNGWNGLPVVGLTSVWNLESRHREPIPSQPLRGYPPTTPLGRRKSMSRPGRNGRSAPGSPLSAGLTLLIIMSAGIGPARPQQAAGPVSADLMPAGPQPGIAVTGPPPAGVAPADAAPAGPAAAALSPDVQVVRFQSRASRGPRSRSSARTRRPCPRATAGACSPRA